jgi:predicted HTH domain antitoxin
MERAAEEVGVSIREMMDYLRQKKIPIQSLEDFERDLKGIYQRLGKISSGCPGQHLSLLTST